MKKGKRDIVEEPVLLTRFLLKEELRYWRFRLRLSVALALPHPAGVIHNKVQITNNCSLEVRIQIAKALASTYKCDMSLRPGETQTCDMGRHCVGEIAGKFYKPFTENGTEVYFMKSYPISDLGCHDFNIIIKDRGGYACVF